MTEYALMQIKGGSQLIVVDAATGKPIDEQIEVVVTQNTDLGPGNQVDVRLRFRNLPVYDPKNKSPDQ